MFPSMSWHCLTFCPLGGVHSTIKAYDEATRLDPNYANAWNNKGLALASQSKYEEAIKAFDQAIRLDPNNSGFVQNKDASLCRLGKCAEPTGFDDTWMNSQPSATPTGHTYHGKSISSSSKMAIINIDSSFLGNLDTKVYHYPSCAWAQKINSENRIWFTDSNEALSAGYKPCKKCNPP